MSKPAVKKIKPVYRLEKDGSFVLEQYNAAKPFSNFFPGIAGHWGIPMWVFYVNRGQAISSLGIESKDKSILEFLPANKAYRMTSLQGFRTFLKVTRAGRTALWEPFQAAVEPASGTHQVMTLTSHDLAIEDRNPGLGVTVNVNYFTVAEEDYPALVRKVTITNTSTQEVKVDVLDGLPLIMPFGMHDWALKNMSRTVEAWVQVKNLEQRAPYYKLNVEVADTPQVKHIPEGNFYFSFMEDTRERALLPVIADPALVFGQATDYASPQNFLRQKIFKVPDIQQTANRTPAAMSHTRLRLPAGKGRTLVSLTGHAATEGHLGRIIRQATATGFVAKKAEDNRAVVNAVKRFGWTHSSSAEFDHYVPQTFLDNVLRGGLPVSLKTSDGNVVFNVYSRKHGDLERDYNYFLLSPTFFSQGNGNYRDVNQNRRNDAWFNRDVRCANIIHFMNLVQADGYNPLVVQGLSFSVKNPDKVAALIQECLKKPDEDGPKVWAWLSAGFQPGPLLQQVSQGGVRLTVTLEEFLGRLLSLCQKKELADHGEGFWSDHWTYNLDLIESFLALYPDQLRSLLWERKDFSFFFNTHYVLPRSQRYLLTPLGVRQYHSVFNDIKNIDASGKGYRLRVQDGEGDVYTTTLLVKLLCLVANKAASLDPSGVGIEMEADKPDWYDALNGLPGLLGSSISESLELKRLCLFLLDKMDTLGLKDEEDLWVFTELATFIKDLRLLLAEEKDPVSLWHRANDIKEHYRQRIRKGIEGCEHDVSLGEVRALLRLVIQRVDKGVERATDRQGMMATYFTHEVTDYALLDKKHNEDPYVLPVNFRRHALPLFLEGFVHALRCEQDQDRARQLYRQLRRSPLFDQKLNMYKVNADLSHQSEEIGRTRIFPPGWLENGSVWLHMEYKYCLELLRQGLYEEFFETMKEVLIPFQDPQRYGRSPIENSSFIVSSAHPDQALHGQGFVARLSGSTAEFVHMWLWMCAGRQPFLLDSQGRLTLALRPALPGWLFSKTARTRAYWMPGGHESFVTLAAHTFAFNFLGQILTVYHNPGRKNTFGPGAAVIRTVVLRYPDQAEPVSLDGAMIPAPYADDVREHRVERIDVYLE